MMTTTRTRTAAEALSVILKRDGVIRPDAVVRDAADPQHTLHDRFEWDDSVAAHAHRLLQARALISSVQVEIVNSTFHVSAQGFVHDPNLQPDEEGYRSVAEIRAKPVDAMSLIQQEVDRVASLVTRTRAIATAVGLEDRANELLRALL